MKWNEALSVLRNAAFIGTDEDRQRIEQAIEVLSAQPETHEKRTETHGVCLDAISRQAAIDALIAEGRNVDSRYLESERIIHESDAIEAIAMLPSAQPELSQVARDIATILENEQDMRVIAKNAQPDLVEWCTDCAEYDKQKNSCPMFNRVIRQTLDDVFDHAETEAEARYHAQRKKGEWEQVEIMYLSEMDSEIKGSMAITSMYCPECKRYHNEVYTYGNPTYGVNYCPNCGAEMGEKKI